MRARTSASKRVDTRRKRSGSLRLMTMLAIATTMTSCTVAGTSGRPTTEPRLRVQAAGVSAGVLLTRTIPGTADHFAARPAMIYLPPITRRHPQRKQPVLILLHGTPGKPSNWVLRGMAGDTADAFAARHGGQAPIIVMPDINGTYYGDTECIRTPTGGDIEHYLQVTVPRWLISHLPADPNRQRWAVIGNSEGGTCAAMLALTRPGSYRIFVNYSGLAHLTLGPADDTGLARRSLFGGSQHRFDEHDPIWLMRHRSYLGLSAWLECADLDRSGRPLQTLLSSAARSAGIETRTEVSRGGHRWRGWVTAFEQTLPWMWSKLTA